MKLLALLAFYGLPLINAQTTSTTGRCGTQFGLTCLGSSFGSCCSAYDYWYVDLHV